MQDDIHAILLLGMIPLTIYISWRYGLAKWEAFRALKCVLLGLSIVIIDYVFFICNCGSGNNPTTQIWIPALLVVVGCFLIVDKAVSIGFLVFVLVSSMGLSWQFHSMVLPADRSICKYTGETDPHLIKNSCERETISKKTWHTPITGIYLLKPID